MDFNSQVRTWDYGFMSGELADVKMMISCKVLRGCQYGHALFLSPSVAKFIETLREWCCYSAIIDSI